MKITARAVEITLYVLRLLALIGLIVLILSACSSKRTQPPSSYSPTVLAEEPSVAPMAVRLIERIPPPPIPPTR